MEASHKKQVGKDAEEEEVTSDHFHDLSLVISEPFVNSHS